MKERPTRTITIEIPEAILDGLETEGLELAMTTVHLTGTGNEIQALTVGIQDAIEIINAVLDVTNPVIE